MALGVAVSLRHIVEIHQNRRMEARAFSHERKCAGIKDANLPIKQNGRENSWSKWTSGSRPVRPALPADISIRN